jgi:hypothetical protein
MIAWGWGHSGEEGWVLLSMSTGLAEGGEVHRHRAAARKRGYSAAVSVCGSGAAVAPHCHRPAVRSPRGSPADVKHSRTSQAN